MIGTEVTSAQLVGKTVRQITGELIWFTDGALLRREARYEYDGPSNPRPGSEYGVWVWAQGPDAPRERVPSAG